MSYKSNRSKVNSLIQQAFHKSADRFGDALDNAMDARIYEWDTTTVRKSGETVGSPRNIVDTGYLKNSRYDVSKLNQRDYIYPADYARDVLEGYIDEWGNSKPGRNWVKVAVESEDWAEVYREEWNQ